MDRKRHLAELARELLVKQLNKNRDLFIREFENSYSEILNSYRDAVKDLVKQAEKQQELGKKNKVQYVAIAVLHSSAITKSYEFQISLLDENYYLDATETSTYWSPKFVYQSIESELDNFFRSAAKQIVRLKPYELDPIRNAYIKVHHNLAELLFMNMTRQIVMDCGMGALNLADEVKLLFGEYMDRGAVFDSVKKGDIK